MVVEIKRKHLLLGIKGQPAIIDVRSSYWLDVSPEKWFMERRGEGLEIIEKKKV
jgi:hypothetical protein